MAELTPLDPSDPRVLATAVSRSKNWPWYQEKIGDKLTPAVKKLLQEYSGITLQDVEAHIYKVVCLQCSPISLQVHLFVLHISHA